MSRFRESIARAVRPFGLAAILCGFAATPAVAAPSFDVTIADDANEVQQVTIVAESGQFKLCFETNCTTDLAWNAADFEVRSALNALPSIKTGAADGSIDVTRLPTGSNAGWYYIYFNGGPLAHTDVPELTAENGTTPLSGLAAKAVVSTIDPHGVARSDQRVEYTTTVKNTGPDPTSGEVTVEVEVPGGLETAVVGTSGSGWSCEKLPPVGLQPAKAVCKRSDVLPAGDSYPPLVVAAGFGVDATDPAVAKATVSGGGTAPPSVSAESQFSFDPPRPFEITSFTTRVPDEAGDEETQAGGHPSLAGATFGFPRLRVRVPANFALQYDAIEDGKSLIVNAPRGFVGNALAIPELCPGQQQVATFTCPLGSVVGGITIEVAGFGNLVLPVYSIVPEFGVPAQFSFAAPIGQFGSPLFFTFVPRLRAEDGYAISFEAAPAPQAPSLLGLPEVTLCSYGAKSNGFNFEGCKKADEPGANETPLITLPTRCEGPPPTTVAKVNSWENPTVFKEKSFTALASTDCDKVPFTPEATFKPTSSQADSPTGLDVEIEMPTDGLEGRNDEGNLDPEAIAQANLKRAKIYFPEGMGVNASAGHGLGSCSAEQVKMKTNDPISCPDSSKIGTIEIDTPLIQETLTGAVYIAKQSDAPPGNLLGLYLVFESKKDGIIIKLQGGVKPDPVTGQLVTTFDESVEAPFSRVAIKFAQGPRSTLITPPKCGTYAVKAEFVPYTIKDLNNPTAAETVTDNTTFEVTEGPNGAPCPSGALEPKLNAGVNNPTAGQHTGFEMRLHREDGTDRFSALGLSLPPGLLGKLKGVPYCPEASIAQAQGRADVEEGTIEINDPSCPSASQIGSVSAGAGAGPNPLYVDTGKAYLAGPYKGAPLSLVVIAPAVAGPLDLGTVVVRNQLRIDRRTAQVSAISDPVPTMLHGVLLDLRDIRLKIDRPNFILNPTNCEPMSFNGEVTGEKAGKAPVSERFQLGGCENLGFKPKLSIHLKGGTKRGDHPALVATLRARPGDANIARAAVTLPRSAFLEQGHIRTICTRVQFAADTCPKGSIYGSTEATTPLLEETLKGNSILRSSDNKLPDLVGTLNGIATVDVIGRIDSVKGGIRTTFDVVPDAPVNEFVLRMQGGKKGLVVNSQDLCAKVNRATVRFTAQNGRQFNFRPAVVADGCKKARKGKKGRGGKARR